MYNKLENIIIIEEFRAKLNAFWVYIIYMWTWVKEWIKFSEVSV